MNDIPPVPEEEQPAKPPRARGPNKPKPAHPESKSRSERWSRLPDIRAWAQTVNDFLYATPVRDDALSPQELDRLTATFDTWQASDAKMHKWVERALTASPGVGFAVVCVGITLDRLARHNMLPFLRSSAPPVPQAPEQPAQAEPYGPEEYATSMNGSMRVGAMP